ncbi:hypothetical protein [Streptomyces sp. NPDC058653]|uniref:hypothetical protein n=1 Tax=Streptomyces sp. NPDC058653 TaxID=3346576 RepID=UPI0036641D77
MAEADLEPVSRLMPGAAGLEQLARFLREADEDERGSQDGPKREKKLEEIVETLPSRRGS